MKYENPIEHACMIQLGQTFICNGWERPEGFCSSAWDTVGPVWEDGQHRRGILLCFSYYES